MLGAKKMLMKLLRNIIRVGKVSSINYDEGKVKVTLPDKDNLVTKGLPYFSFEYNMPDIGDTVLCVFLPNGLSRGFCLGKFYNKNNLPKQPGEQFYYKNIYDEAHIEYNKEKKKYILHAGNLVFETESLYYDFIRENDESYFRYDPDSETMSLSAPNIILDGEVNITNNLTVDGGLSVTGDISTDKNISAKGNITAVGTITGANIQ